MFLRKVAQSVLRSTLGGNSLKNGVDVFRPISWSAMASIRHGSDDCPKNKVAVLGAAGAVGRPLGLLLKQFSALDELYLYDLLPTGGYGKALDQIDTKCKMQCGCGPEMLCNALEGASVVIIVASGGGKDDFTINAPIVTELTLQICNVCPESFVIVATQPVESMAPLVAEIKRLRGSYNPRKVIGVVDLHCIRANSVLATYLNVPPEHVNVPMIGGASSTTMVPVLSKVTHPCPNLTDEEILHVTRWIANGQQCACYESHTEPETAYLSGSYGIASCTKSVVNALRGMEDITICAYADSCGQCCPNIQFFTTDLKLGPSGIEKVHCIPDLSCYENSLLWSYLPYIRKEGARANWLAYKMCAYTECFVQPSNTYCSTPAVKSTQPAVTWSPEFCSDEHLAAVCRELAFRTSSTALCWCPPKSKLDPEYAATNIHTLTINHASCKRSAGSPVPSSMPWKKWRRQLVFARTIKKIHLFCFQVFKDSPASRKNSGPCFEFFYQSAFIDLLNYGLY